MSTSPTTRLIVTIAPCRNGSHSIMVSLQDDLSTRVGHNDRGSSAPTRNATFVDAVQAAARAR
jgi:hypothetical protein